MKKSRTVVGYILIAFGIVAIAMSVFCYMNAARIEDRLMERVVADPFTIG